MFSYSSAYGRTDAFYLTWKMQWTKLKLQRIPPGTHRWSHRHNTVYYVFFYTWQKKKRFGLHAPTVANTGDGRRSQKLVYMKKVEIQSGGEKEEWKPVGGRHVTGLGGGAEKGCSVIHLPHEHRLQACLTSQAMPGRREKKNIKYINNE